VVLGFELKGNGVSSLSSDICRVISESSISTNFDEDSGGIDSNSRSESGDSERETHFVL